MRISNEMLVAAEPDAVFQLLADVEQLAPCLPGAEVTGRRNGAYEGSMKVKIGPVAVEYAGTIEIVEMDDRVRRAVMAARATDVHGRGSAEAKISTSVAAEGDGSRIQLDTDLQMRGRVAQLGSGAIGKVSERLFSEFAANLEQLCVGGPGAATRDSPTGAVRPESPASEEPGTRAAGRGRPAAAASGQGVDALELLGLPLRSNAVKTGALALAAFAYGYLLGRLRELRR